MSAQVEVGAVLQGAGCMTHEYDIDCMNSTAVTDLVLFMPYAAINYGLTCMLAGAEPG